MFRGKFLAGSCGRFFVTAFLVIFSGAVFATGTYNGGDGTESNPYQIRTAQQLIELSQHSEDWGKGFILTDDIDMDPNLLGEGVVMSPIGNSTIPFLGVFDGGGHVISNLTINLPDSDNVGLFGYLKGEVRNLVLDNVSVTGRNNVGGLVGANNGSISICSGSGVVNGTMNVGGLAGNSSRGISQCCSSGVINGYSRAGGLIGAAGGHYAIIENCYSSADVNCWGGGGGFSGSIESCTIIHCYSSGAVNGEEPHYLRGFAFPSVTFYATACFWDIEASGRSEYIDGGGIYGLNSDFMKSSRVYSYCGWSGDVWTIDEGNDYPRLAWENKPGIPMPESGFQGSGTTGDPFRLERAVDIRILSFDSSLWDKHFVLTCDIDLDGVFLTPIGSSLDSYDRSSSSFTGSFDGGGHVISNLKIDLPDYNFVGLFASTHTSSEIKNLGLRDVDINGYKNVGGLVGSNSGNISQCFVTGSVSGVENVGGFAGSNGDYSFDLYGVIDDCYSICSVTGEEVVGGLIGRMSGGTVNRSYSASIVDGNLYSGGFAGLRSMAGTCSYCFWDITLNSGLHDTGFGDYPEIIGLSTTLIQSMEIYGLAGWAGDVWTIDEGNDYPRLAWENAEGVKIPDNGAGTMEDPIRIGSAGGLVVLSNSSSMWDKHIVLTSDIDMEPAVTGIEPFDRSLIGQYEDGDSVVFTGTFDGHGHVISNVVIQAHGKEKVGLFGRLFNGGSILNLGVENISIIGGEYIGGLAGECFSENSVKRSRISGCYTTGSLIVSRYAGGIAGFTFNCDIVNSYSSCSIKGSGAGGIIGVSYGITVAEKCYYNGILSGEYLDGIVGIGTSDGITDCYWDTDVSGVGSGTGGVGLSTEDMMRIDSYAGWDFVGESDNGELDFWRLCVDGSGYPRLAWEFQQYGDLACPDGVGIDDLVVMSMNWLATSTETEPQSADINCDGSVNILDMKVLLQNWLKNQ